MMTLLSILLLGFFLGMRHATDSDHVVAVTTIVSRQRSSWKRGAHRDFVGHRPQPHPACCRRRDYLFRHRHSGATGFEPRVLRGLNARSARGLESPGRNAIYSASTRFSLPKNMIMSIGTAITCTRILTATNQETTVTVRIQCRRRAWIASSVALKWYRAIRPIVIGVVHGLAGSAAVALLVLPIIQRPTWALAYLIVFGLGTVTGMMLMTATIAVPIAYTARFNFLNRHFGTAAGALSLGFGLFLAYQIGFVDGLFTH